MPSRSSIHISASPRGSVAGSQMTGTRTAASLAWSARTFRTWIQVITERPRGRPRARRPQGNPWPRKKPSLGGPAARTPGRRPGPRRRGGSGGCGPGRRGAPGSGCAERPRHYPPSCSVTREVKRARGRSSMLTMSRQLGVAAMGGAHDRCHRGLATSGRMAHPTWLLDGR
jgi:hypothetical protein